MPLALAGSLTAVQFRYPAELPLALNKIEHFSKVSSDIIKYHISSNIQCDTRK